MVLRSFTFMSARAFGSSRPSSSMLAIRHVLEQKMLSGLFFRKIVFKQAYPKRPLKVVVLRSTGGMSYSILGYTFGFRFFLTISFPSSSYSGSSFAIRDFFGVGLRFFLLGVSASSLSSSPASPFGSSPSSPSGAAAAAVPFLGLPFRFGVAGVGSAASCPSAYETAARVRLPLPLPATTVSTASSTASSTSSSDRGPLST